MTLSTVLAAWLVLAHAGDVHEERSTLALDAGGQSYTKRFVLRYPDAWNGRLVIGAHGGSGGESYSRDGEVTGTDEVSLDDVVGDHAVAHGFAYASIDRDGIGGTGEGLELTKAFTRRMRARLRDAAGRDVEKTYIAGLSMGGFIARRAAEDPSTPYDGALIIVGAGGDRAARRERSKAMAELWPELETGSIDADVYAEAVGTPPEAARFWPFMGRSTSGRSRVADGDDSTGALVVPTVEVAGTYDDFVYPELVVYKEKVRRQGASALHRLYEVRGAWHISPDDDAIASFQYIGSRMGLSEETLDAMATGASYLPTVREALLLLDAWVMSGEPPPADQSLDEGQPLLP
jgi:hypothetical protein